MKWVPFLALLLLCSTYLVRWIASSRVYFLGWGSPSSVSIGTGPPLVEEKSNKRRKRQKARKEDSRDVKRLKEKRAYATLVASSTRDLPIPLVVVPEITLQISKRTQRGDVVRHHSAHDLFKPLKRVKEKRATNQLICATKYKSRTGRQFNTRSTHTTYGGALKCLELLNNLSIEASVLHETPDKNAIHINTATKGFRILESLQLFKESHSQVIDLRELQIKANHLKHLQEGNKRQMNVEESGNWKRRKTSRDDDTEDDQENEQEEGEGTQGDVNGDKAPNEGPVLTSGRNFRLVSEKVRATSCDLKITD
ncbi:hypothetical protein RR48_15424 [Papilio machaon]|uniref:Uncharacterized protein n=1 Tax=Papilio machaon TaxID=76193 RepID=A0A194QUS6_PAPMA|nr:hypothetical protein RR48_15424 [Papilio machaon]